MTEPGWDTARDARLRRLRAAGVGWPHIAAALGVSADRARERGRRIGAPYSRPAPASPAEDRDEDSGRDPLPPGHTLAWALLTEGTLLANTPWPGISWQATPSHGIGAGAVAA